jgi:hypothetical protein
VLMTDPPRLGGPYADLSRNRVIARYGDLRFHLVRAEQWPTAMEHVLQPRTRHAVPFDGESAIGSGIADSISSSYSSASWNSSWLSGDPSTAISAIGSTNKHSAHTVGFSRRARAVPRIRALTGQSWHSKAGEKASNGQP